jgi:peroxiredoxin
VNKIKRFFILPYLLATMLASVHSVVMCFTSDDTVLWLGASLSLLPILLYMLSIALAGRGRAAAKLHVQLVLAVFGLAITVYALSQHYIAGRDLSLLPFLYALVLGLFGLLLYDYWYSDLRRQNQGDLALGAPLPAIELLNSGGGRENNEDWIGSPFLLMFIRGNWCPLCVAQVKEVAAQYQALEAQGVAIKIVTPQPEKDTRVLAERFNVPMQFYVDSDNAAAEALGIVHRDGVPAGMPGYGTDTVFPTVLMCDDHGAIIFSDQTNNYRDRPTPEHYLNVLQSSAEA